MAMCTFISQCEVVTDCRDNFPTAYAALENRYCGNEYSECARYKWFRTKKPEDSKGA